MPSGGGVHSIGYRDPGTDYEALLVDRNAPRWLRQFAQVGRLEDQGDGTFRINWEVQPAAPGAA